MSPILNSDGIWCRNRPSAGRGLGGVMTITFLIKGVSYCSVFKQVKSKRIFGIMHSYLARWPVAAEQQKSAEKKVYNLAVMGLALIRLIDNRLSLSRFLLMRNGYRRHKSTQQSVRWLLYVAGIVVKRFLVREENTYCGPDSVWVQY